MSDNPLQQFMRFAPTTALGNFERLVNAIKNQDQCVLEGNELGMQTWKSIAACAAMNLARDHADETREALSREPKNDSLKASRAIADGLAGALRDMEVNCLHSRWSAGLIRRALLAYDAARKGDGSRVDAPFCIGEAD